MNPALEALIAELIKAAAQEERLACLAVIRDIALSSSQPKNLELAASIIRKRGLK